MHLVLSRRTAILLGLLAGCALALAGLARPPAARAQVAAPLRLQRHHASPSPSPVASPSPSPVASPSSSLVPATTWYGTLATGGAHDSADVQSHVGVATLELSWQNYETGQGVFDANYVAQEQQKLQSFKSAGMLVALDAGVQYPPSWVFGLNANTYYVNQYGDRYAPTGNPGLAVANAVFDPAVREAMTAYLARIAQDFGDSFSFVRAGGGWYSELHYPAASYNGHGNSYWAFDANAQTGSPVPGWRPGQCCSTQAQQFWDYYVSSLVRYQNWQVSTYRTDFPSALVEVLYPGWGVRPGQDTAAVDGDLSGGTSAEINGETEQGNLFSAEVNNLSTTGTAAYTTWLDAADQGTTVQSESPVGYLQYLARPLGIPVAGENAGSQSLSAMQLCVSRVKNMGLLGMSWAWESNLYSGTSPTITDYANLIG